MPLRKLPTKTTPLFRTISKAGPIVRVLHFPQATQPSSHHYSQQPYPRPPLPPSTRLQRANLYFKHGGNLHFQYRNLHFWDQTSSRCTNHSRRQVSIELDILGVILSDFWSYWDWCPDVSSFSLFNWIMKCCVGLSYLTMGLWSSLNFSKIGISETNFRSLYLFLNHHRVPVLTPNIDVFKDVKYKLRWLLSWQKTINLVCKKCSELVKMLWRCQLWTWWMINCLQQNQTTFYKF